ncbi:hypothetical protein AA105894_1847 [Asaia spathodeae NBRC 105894]|nr:hypothetical protein AA105894_1847 [Asaia spathodeae NBRC 105894]
MQNLPLFRPELVEECKARGFVIVPIAPTNEMLEAGAPACFQAYDGTWDMACSAARTCYAAMIEVSAL